MSTIHTEPALHLSAGSEAVLKIEDLEAPLGALVSGLDFTQPLQAGQILALRKALRERHILLLRGQRLDDEQFLRFASYFGSIYRPPSGEQVLGLDPFSGQMADIVKVSNVEGGVLGRHALAAHTDHHWTQLPSSSSLLYALEVPRVGGDTTFYNLPAAYDALDEATKREIEGLQLITYSPFLRHRNPLPSRVIPRYRTPDIEPLSPYVTHPLVRTHPDSGRKLLYLSTDTEVELINVEPQRGAALIERLRAHLLQPRFAYPHRWQVGDIIYWDNQATLHGRTAFDSSERRVMKRISLAGSRPF
jgi:taurine dioxygenase